MPKKSNKFKIIIIILVACIVLALVVTQIGGSSKEDTTQSTGLVTVTATGAPVNPGVIANTDAPGQSSELVSLLKNVSSLKLSRDVFSSPVFSALVDISSQVPEDLNPGRRNPFLEIGNEPSLIYQTSLLQDDASDVANGADSDGNNSLDLVGDDALNTFLNSGAPNTP